MLLGAVGKKSVMADTHVASWAHVQEKAADELRCVHLHDLGLVSISPVSVGEGDGTVFDVSDSMVGDGHTVSVSAEIIEDLFGTCEGFLGKDNPRRFPQLIDQVAEDDGVFHVSNDSREAEFSLVEVRLKRLDKLPPEDL